MLHQKRLLVAARVQHYWHLGRFWSYTPYVRELDQWADLFATVTIAGSLKFGPPPGDCSAFSRDNVRVVSIPEAGGEGWFAKLRQLYILPKILWKLAACMRNADAIHARCPCDLGLLGVLLGPMFSRNLIAKYATQWPDYPGEPFTWRLQKRLLKSPWWRGPVTVYGQWPGQPSRVIPFFTSMLTEEQIARARAAASRSRDPSRFRVLFVGRLSASKNVDVLLQAVAALKSGREVSCVIVGEGPQRAVLEGLAGSLGISTQVRFTGGLGFDDVLGWYERSDVLVLASGIEGWPKAVAEAMAFGCVCVGSERGMMPQMLGEGRGLLVTPRDPKALTRALQWIADHPEAAADMAARAAAWAQRYSLNGLREALRRLMLDSWNLEERAAQLPLKPREVINK